MATPGTLTTREFLDALYRDNTDAIVRAGARSARYHDQHRRPFPLLKEGDKVIYKAALGGYFAAMSGVDAAATKLKSLPPWQGPYQSHCGPPYPNERVRGGPPRGTRVHRRINAKTLRPGWRPPLRQAPTRSRRARRREARRWGRHY